MLITSFSRRLRVLRAERGWTQRYAATRARIRYSRYVRAEQNTLALEPREYERLANAFGVSSIWSSLLLSESAVATPVVSTPASSSASDTESDPALVGVTR